MVEGNRMLATLLDLLGELEISLSGFIFDASTTDFSIANERSSLTNMKKVLDTLVKKSVAQKHSDEDIAAMNTKPVEYTDHNFETLISTEDYMAKTKHLFNRTPNLESLKGQLLTFQELLGDILYSTCQITNCNSKSPSGVLVKDLLSVEKCYLKIWDLTVLISSKLKNQEINRGLEYKEETMHQLQNIYCALYKCVKELVKVKLSIEHFLRVNLVEMELFAHDICFENNGCEKALTKKISQTSLKGTKMCQKEEDCKTNWICRQEESTAFENISNTDLQQEDLFKNETFSPQEVLYFQQGTIFIQSTLGMRLNPSSPKIYSVDSIEEIKPYFKTDKNNNHLEKTNIDEKQKIHYLQGDETHVSSEKLISHTGTQVEIPPVPMINLEKSTVCKGTEALSLFNIPKTDTSRDNSLFKASPLKIERSDVTCSEPFWKTDLSIKKDPNMAKKNVYDNDRANKNYHLHDFESDKNKNFNEQKFGEQTFFFPYQIPDKVSLTGKSVVFDEESVVELFKYPGPCKDRDVPHSYQTNSYNIWPVSAEYIHVSKAKNIDSGNSATGSESSFSMTKKCKESFFSLQLNKRLEEKPEYDGDMIVLDSPAKCCGGESSYSHVNQSYIVYDSDHVELNKISSQPNLSCKIKELKNEKDFKVMKRTVKENNKHILTRQVEDNKYLVENKYFSRDRLDFSKLNEYNVHGNWNSYISIFTTKVGPSSRINHHRVIQRIINKFEAEPLKENVHTLTSNRGPFRLFDLNGYPLTDSAGNVLKDPYGKVVVNLDSTGLPKDNTHVFDAEGYSPKDFKFDPTQKPKINSVVIKLTDNFKRPLHLFDKYGRPLTDSNGNLLVNIHGRPLLRFDNFGRPTTDYRGGTLYTDNGFRWTFQNDYDHLSNEHTRNIPFETPSKGLNANSKELRNDNFEKVVSSRNDNMKKLHDTQCTDKTQIISQQNNRTADKWSAIENILQTVLKKQKLETKISQTGMMVNNATVSPVDKVLNPIIYHDNLTSNNNSFTEKTVPLKFAHNLKRNGINNLKGNDTDVLGMNGVTKTSASVNCHLIENNTSDKAKHLQCDIRQSILKDPAYFSLNRNMLLDNKCLKCTPKNFDFIKPEHYNSLNTYQQKRDFFFNPHSISNKEHFLKTLVSPAYPNYYTTFKKHCTPSYFTFKNHDYINDSQVHRYTEHSDNVKSLPKQDILNNKYKRWTDTSYTYSDVNTTEFTQSDSLTMFMQNRKRAAEEKEKLENKCKNRANYAGDQFDKDRKIISDKESFCKIISSQTQKKLHDIVQSYKDSKSSLSRHVLSLNILNQGDTHYEIKVADKTHTLGGNLTGPLQNMRDTKAAVENTKPDSLDQTKENNCDPYRCSENKVCDSQFRFKSNDKLDKTLKGGEKYIRQCQMDTNSTKSNKQPNARVVKIHSPNLKPSNLRNDAKKSPQQRECTLVSFLGIPMKYVLKKLDSRKSPKPHKRNKSNRNHATTIHQRNKAPNETKIKTLYDGSKLGKQFMSSSNESKPRKKLTTCKRDKQQGLLAFKSKSSTEIRDFKGIAMSYSGKRTSEMENNLKDLPSTSQELKRISSLIILSSDSPARSACYNKKSRTPRHISQRPRGVKRQNFYNTGSSGKTYRHSPERSKDRKQSSGRHKKSIKLNK